mgnify:CR=1 FL=1
MMNENAEIARWTVLEILKKMERLERCMSMAMGAMGTLQDRMAYLEQEFIGFVDAVEDLRSEVQDIPDILGVKTC